MLSTHTHTHTHTHIYIYIYIYLLINYLPVFTVPEKNKKPLARNQEKKNISNHGPEEKEKVFWVKKKEKTNLVLLLEKNQGGNKSVAKRKPKNPPRILQCYNY